MTMAPVGSAPCRRLHVLDAPRPLHLRLEAEGRNLLDEVVPHAAWAGEPAACGSPAMTGKCAIARSPENWSGDALAGVTSRGNSNRSDGRPPAAGREAAETLDLVVGFACHSGASLSIATD